MSKYSDLLKGSTCVFINGELFKRFENNYFVSADGKIFSVATWRLMKHYIDHDGYHRVDIYKNKKPKHMKIHKIVYLTWVGKIEKGMQINHKDDNKENNHYTNLYAGTQKENIHDCIRNKHRVGSSHHLTVYDRKKDRVLTFFPAKKFMKYSGHYSSNGCVMRFFNKDWFKKRYEIIEYGLGKV